MKNNKNGVGKIIREIRKSKGMGCQEFSQFLKVPNSYISNLEKNIEEVTSRFLEKLSEHADPSVIEYIKSEIEKTNEEKADSKKYKNRVLMALTAKELNKIRHPMNMVEDLTISGVGEVTKDEKEIIKLLRMLPKTKKTILMGLKRKARLNVKDYVKFYEIVEYEKLEAAR